MTTENYQMQEMEPFFKDIPEDCKVGKFDMDEIEHKKLKNLHHGNRNTFWTIVTHYKSSFIGVTWKCLVVWAVVFLIAEGLAYQANQCGPKAQVPGMEPVKAPVKDPGIQDPGVQGPKVKVSIPLQAPTQQEEMGIMCMFVKAMKTVKTIKAEPKKKVKTAQPAVGKKCSPCVEKKKKKSEKKNTFASKIKELLTEKKILLGFFVITTIKRWWDQTSKLPHLTDIAVQCLGIMQARTKGEESCRKAMREILRYCSLSYAIVMLSISSNTEGVSTNKEIIDYLLKKELATEEELKKLGFLQDNLDEYFFTTHGGAMQMWYAPIMWASRIVQKERLNDGHLKEDWKNVASSLKFFKHDLEVVADYSQRPLPALAIQALEIAFWAFLVFGTLDNSHSFLDKVGFKGFFLDFLFHLDELIVYITIYAWLKMAKIIQNPFDGDKHYDINVIQRIEIELFEGTVAINSKLK